MTAEPGDAKQRRRRRRSLLPEDHPTVDAIAAFVDEELSSLANERVLAHLDHCAECRRMVEEQQIARLRLRAACDSDAMELPASLRRRLAEIPEDSATSPQDSDPEGPRGGSGSAPAEATDAPAADRRAPFPGLRRRHR